MGKDESIYHLGDHIRRNSSQSDKVDRFKETRNCLQIDCWFLCIFVHKLHVIWEKDGKSFLLRVIIIILLLWIFYIFFYLFMYIRSLLISLKSLIFWPIFLPFSKCYLPFIDFTLHINKHAILHFEHRTVHNFSCVYFLRSFLLLPTHSFLFYFSNSFSG